MSALCWIALLVAAPDTATRALSLAEAVELALAVEPAVGVARIARDRADLELLRAELGRFHVSVDAQIQEIVGASDLTGDVETQALGLSNLSANVTVPIFAGFGIEANVDRAEHLAVAAAHDVERARRETALAVARAYWSTRKLDLLRDVLARALERLQRAEDTAAARVRAGLAPPIDQNRARARRLAQQVVLARLQGTQREAGAHLATLLGIGGPLVLTDHPRSAAEPPPHAVLIARARSARAEVRAAVVRVEAGRDALRIAEAGWYPRVDAVGLVQAGNNPLLAGVGARGVSASANPFASPTVDVQAGVAVSINLFDTFATRTAVDEARLEIARLEREVRRAERTVELEVRTARERVVRLVEALRALAPADEVARDNVEIIQSRYENGEALVFELLDAELELLALEQQHTETAADLELALRELEAAVGGES